MKKILISYVALFCLFVAPSYGASYKVVDKSSRRVPDWVGGNEKGYFILSTVNFTSLDGAKVKLIEQVKLKVLEAVAQNVDYRSLSSLKQTTNSEGMAYKDEFMNVIKINSANIPFISSISESKIEDYYWEIRRNKSNDKLSYSYSIKYPYSLLEIKELVRKFEKRDNEMTERYDNLKMQLNNISSLDQIEECRRSCSELIEYFFDSTRKKSAEQLQKMYLDLYNNITVVTYSEKLGEATFGLLLNGNKLLSSLRPTVRYDRDDISSVVIAPMNGDYKLTYDPSFCTDRLPYTFQIWMYINGRRVGHDIHFTYTKNSVSLEPRGKIYLTADSLTNDIINGISVDMQLECKGITGGLTINRITLETPSTQGLISVMQPFSVANANGIFTIKFRCDAPMEVKRGYHSSSTIKIARGEVQGYWGSSNTPIKAKIALPYSCNW